MARLTWDGVGEKVYETGIDQCVLYVYGENGYEAGVAWNGVTGFTESPSGAEPTKLYADNIVYANIMSTEQFGGTLTAYTYPDEFAACDGSANLTTGLKIGQQKRATFALCYRTIVGDDTDEEAGYIYHIVYGCKASPSERSRETVNETPAAMQFSWTISTTPVEVENAKPTAYVEIDSRGLTDNKLTAVLNKLYGTDAGSGTSATDPTLLLPDDLKDLIDSTT